MEESLSEILERPDVQYAMKKRELIMREKYRKRYSMRFASFFYHHAYNRIFHLQAYKEIEDVFQLTEREFTILLGCLAISKGWAIDNMFTLQSVWETFFSDEFTIASFKTRMSDLRAKKKLFVAVTRQSLKPTQKIMIQELVQPGDKLYQLTDLALTIPLEYNKALGLHLNNFAKKHGEIKMNLASMMHNVLKYRSDLVGNDAHLKDEIDQIILSQGSKSSHI